MGNCYQKIFKMVFKKILIISTWKLCINCTQLGKTSGVRILLFAP